MCLFCFCAEVYLFFCPGDALVSHYGLRCCKFVLFLFGMREIYPKILKSEYFTHTLIIAVLLLLRNTTNALKCFRQALNVII